MWAHFVKAILCFATSLPAHTLLQDYDFYISRSVIKMIVMSAICRV